MNTIKKIGFIGLGVMGGAMARHLREAQFDVFVYNRTHQKAIDWAAFYGGIACQTPQELAEKVDVVVLCVGNDNDIREVVTGKQGVLQTLKKGGIIIDHTTSSRDVAIEMAKACEDKGCFFLDAPVSGGQIGAQKGTLTAMVGGDQMAFLQVDSILAAYTKHRKWFGESGTGQLCKMVNQTLIAGLLQGLSEGLSLAMKSGIDIEQLVDTLKYGAAQSWQLENRAVTMSQHQFNFGFAVEHMIKDLNIVLDQAKQLGLEMPITQTVEGYYRELSSKEHSRSDTSCLIERLVPNVLPKAKE